MVARMAVDTTRLVLRAVNFNWNSNDRNWNVEANSVLNMNEWNDGNQVFSRNCRMESSAISQGICFSGH